MIKTTHWPCNTPFHFFPMFCLICFFKFPIFLSDHFICSIWMSAIFSHSFCPIILSVLFECPIFCPIFFWPIYLNVRFFLSDFFIRFFSDLFKCPIFLVRSILMSDLFVWFFIRSIWMSDFFVPFFVQFFVHVCCTCKVAFLLIRPIVVFSLRSPLFGRTRFYILFEQTINIIERFAFSAG